ncbi:TonB-dependent receptor [Lutibacter sp.]|uniref:TonB-dependent receptor n=1 Tax=Lutibacter sp. TaxID=1925666 RepID=UPI0027323428|nr:TonB-dependent receptor [Lutibacter sp.]MDP3312244.1 TonB-dependent receptor [Lutibacter sp.]
MNRLAFTAFVWFVCIQNLISQSTATLHGIAIDVVTNIPIKNASIQIVGTTYYAQTNDKGVFSFSNFSNEAKEIVLEMEGYKPKTIHLNLDFQNIFNLENIYFEKLPSESPEDYFITLTEDDFNDDEEVSSNYIAGLFQSSKDAYLRAAAFNFSQAWFKVRGYDSSYGTISINGVEMNKLYDKRPQWSNWGGLNDVFKNQTFTNGIAASENTFGGVLGSTSFSTRASEYRKTNKISLASSNRSYTQRVMATYISGELKNNWHVAASGSFSAADEGYMEGTTYKAWSSFVAVEKKINENNSLNFTAIAAFNRRGKSAPNTQEVYNLKGLKYNPYWGEQENSNRNSRIKAIFEPIVMLSHFYDNNKITLKTTISYQDGHIGNSRLGYYNAPNPDPTYWKYLPSNYLRNTANLDYANAYLATQELQTNGQLNWNALYQQNSDNGNALYYLYEDRIDDRQFNLNTLLHTFINSTIQLNIGATYKNLNSHNFAKMEDLLGANSFLDINYFAEGDAMQSNLNNPNRLVKNNETFQYNYKIAGSVADLFAQIQSTTKKVDYFVGMYVNSTNYQRDGLYMNGLYPNSSFGASDKQHFFNLSCKAGITYKFNGRNLITINGAFVSNAPTIKNTFSNARVNNSTSPNITSESIVTADASYVFRLPKFQSRITPYFTKFSNGINISFFFAEGLFGSEADFVNEIVTGIDKKHMGIEFSFEAQLISSLKLIAAGSVGQFTYDNNPDLYLQSESITLEKSYFGSSFLKNYKVSGTPQTAFSTGFEYRDPQFWWFQANANYLANNYISISPLLRTKNFYLDGDEVPFLDSDTGVEITQNQVRALLKQEKFNATVLINVVGGKSWKINNYYLGFFAGINNMLGKVFKTGGFEQSRNANYIELKQDQSLLNPIFGSKYWYGNKTSYFLNFYVRI